MTKDRIMAVASILPDNLAYFAGMTFLPGRRGKLTEQDRRTALRSKALFDPAFGWVCVQTLLDAGTDFPSDIYERWLGRAYWAYVSEFPDDVVAEASSIETPHRSHARALVRAFLILRDTDTEDIALHLGMDHDVLECYEQLFWNVRDRLDDHTYISHLVFPEGRRVEMEPNYLRRESLEHLLLRAVYGGHFKEAAQLAGLMPSALKLGNADSSAAELESMIMSNAAYLAKLGGLNQSDVPGVHAARQLVAAAKASGQQEKASDERLGLGALNHGAAILETLSGMGEDAVARQQALIEAKDTGEPKSE